MEVSVLQSLARQIQAVESGANSVVRQGVSNEAPVSTGWPDVDELPRGVLHEWFGFERARCPSAPPVSFFVHLATCALDPEDWHTERVLWIGRSVWPYPQALIGEGGADRRLLRQSVFIDPPDNASRFWAVDLALRCPLVVAVFADGTGMKMPETRRLQLAARSRCDTARPPFASVARPTHEQKTLSAAALRWRVAVARSRHGPRFELELLRAKGISGSCDEPAFRAKSGVEWARRVGKVWSLEWDSAKNRLGPFPVLVGRSSATPFASPADVLHGRSVANVDPTHTDLTRGERGWSADRRTTLRDRTTSGNPAGDESLASHRGPAGRESR